MTPKYTGCVTPDACRIRTRPYPVTDMYFPPVYDGYGNNLNPDRNFGGFNAECSTCKRKWSVSSVGDQQTWAEIKAAAA